MIVYTNKWKIPFQIDDTDWERVKGRSWHISAYGYPATKLRQEEGGKVIVLHLFLLGKAPEGLEWDHLDRDPLNNRRDNLRAVTHSQNIWNSKTRSDNPTGVRGVTIHKQDGRRYWTATFDGEYLGCFSSVEEAARVRQNAENKNKEQAK